MKTTPPMQDQNDGEGERMVAEVKTDESTESPTDSLSPASSLEEDMPWPWEAGDGNGPEFHLSEHEIRHNAQVYMKWDKRLWVDDNGPQAPWPKEAFVKHARSIRPVRWERRDLKLGPVRGLKVNRSAKVFSFVHRPDTIKMFKGSRATNDWFVATLSRGEEEIRAPFEEGFQYMPLCTFPPALKQYLRAPISLFDWWPWINKECDIGRE